ncbi:Endonuclease/exonuclease/phosphatase [Irpex rosettiformis]|uniref:Endonuclease/exonuclease/phosphatase n=1 Tax=Irpex rosettiformis TaxID=378272 RepID=A0ACB8U2B5_9APHY|nr:Endonuclease/exonuclease/phosphatase [Irpex rosettiformis]
MTESTSLRNQRRGLLLLSLIWIAQLAMNKHAFFCFRPKPLSSEYLVERAFPILDGFSISVAQPRRQTIDLSVSPSTTALPEPRSELTLTINPGYDPAKEPLILLTQDTQRLRSLLAETKRLRDISIANSEPGTQSAYTWTLPYQFRPDATILSPVPQDLRHAHRPLHELLSTAAAGTSTPASDAYDISVIREDWIRSQVRARCCALASEGQQTSLRMRIGTFNVNGKLPSQDLAAWVQPQTQGHPVLENWKFIPPLPEVSPFELEVSTTRPLDVAMSDLTVTDKNDKDGPSVKGSVETPTPSISVDSDVMVAHGGDENAAQEVFDVSHTHGNSNEVKKATTILQGDSDLIVLGFQELDLSAGALLYSTETTREDAWFGAAMAGLGEKAEHYVKLVSKQLVGMLLLVIVKRSLRGSFSQIQTASVGAGIMGLMGNKGATALRLVFTPEPTPQASSPRSVVLTFVNSHLAAFDEMYEKRNADFYDLSKRLAFDSTLPLGDYDDRGAAPSLRSVPLNVYQSDVLFWLGDLNYRLNLPDSDVRTLLTRKQDRAWNVPELLKYDQLNTAMRTRSAFANFKEFPITHLPSYRYGTGLLADSLGYDLKRKPAWTDRILHMCSYTAYVKQLGYRSHTEVTMSDHRPVSADLNLYVPVVDSAALDEHAHALWMGVANIEQPHMAPQLAVEPTIVEFGKIRYKHPDRKVVRVENTGKIASTFRFISLDSSGDTHPRWLRVEPVAALVPAGEHVDIILSVDVCDSEAATLNREDAQLDCLLILHTSLGKDHFVAVSGIWERTCFATSLQRLVRMTAPVRSLKKPQLVSEDQAATAPKELTRLVSWLMNYAAEEDDLFFFPGELTWVSTFQESLDTGADLPKPSGNNKSVLSLSAAQCLLQFLASLPDALAPPFLHVQCAGVSNRDEAFELLNEFLGVSVNVWIAVTSFLHFICQQKSSSDNARRAERLGV